MSSVAILAVLLSGGFALAAAWAAWVSKTLVSILTMMQGLVHRVADLEDKVEDHEGRIRKLEIP